jgi:aspartate/tyrosine/aromatic aminotransferase
MAYQGFTTGDTELDAYAVRLFAETDIPLFLA